MTFEEKELLLQISVLAESCEQEVCPMPMQPQSLLEMIQVKMFERRLKQKELASLLEISDTTLSEILNGKRKINLDLSKNLYKRMGISADFILEAV